MRNTLYIVFFLIIGFLLNIFVYYISTDYRDFLKEMKGIDNNIVDSNNLTDNKDYNIDINNFLNNNKTSNDKVSNDDTVDKEEKIHVIDSNNVDYLNQKPVDAEENKVEYISITEELSLTKIEENFLNIFKEYSLKEIKLHPRLFDLTSEYPDEYYEYYSEYLTLYFFGNKPYGQLKDIFEVLAYELPFTINETNNFGDKSFYINLNKDFQDTYVRLIILYKNRTFGLKIKKELYSHVKEKLNNLINN